MPLPMPRLPPVIRAARLRRGTVAPGNSGALVIMNFLGFGVGVGEKGLATEAQREAREEHNEERSFASLEEKTEGKDARLKSRRTQQVQRRCRKRAQQRALLPIQKRFYGEEPARRCVAADEIASPCGLLLRLCR